MTPRARVFGFWLPVYDARSAQDAVKMGGLPLLFSGGQALVFALTLGGQGYVRAALGAAVLGVLLAVAAFKIRGGAVRLMPWAAFVYVPFIGLNLFNSYLFFVQYRAALLLWPSLAGMWVVPVFCVVLILGGLRGWQWLRAAEAPDP